MVHGHGPAGLVEGAVPGETAADEPVRFGMGDEVVEFKAHPLELDRPGVHPDEIVIVERSVEGDTQVDDRVHEPALLNLAVRVGGVPHEGCPAQLEIPEVVRVVHDLGPVRVRVQRPVAAPVPDVAGGAIAHEPIVVVEHFRPEGFRFHATPP